MRRARSTAGPLPVFGEDPGRLPNAWCPGSAAYVSADAK